MKATPRLPRKLILKNHNAQSARTLRQQAQAQARRPQLRQRFGRRRP